MQTITTIDALEELYDAAVPGSLAKVVDQITPHYRTWIEASRFCVLSTVGPEGVDASPRGDDGPVVVVDDVKTLMMPDWRGNNRLDSLRNIVRDPRVSLMFMVPGSKNVVRVIGKAQLYVDPDLRQRFEKKGQLPKTVIVVQVDELYYQCAKAIMRSGLWSSDDESHLVPTAGAFLKERQQDFDGDTYDADYSKNAQPKMW